MNYRREIDGLRAVAVLPVILFHAGFHVFSGGYVGVDVFFVISGYLITSILISELEAGNFSITRFYERRARRILPALFVVMLACLPFAYLWMLPSQLRDFSQSLVAVVLFASNILFWREDGYFAAAAELKPLLHTWSLAVEEQYYLLFPVFLWLFWRFRRQRVLWTVVGLAALSLLLAEWGWRNAPSANFYLAPTRAWELLAGSICAFLMVGRPQRSSNVLSAAGLALILFSVFVYNEGTPFPSVYTLAPILGTALIILYAAQGTWTARLLSMPVFVGVGLISYSAYLWHQPLFAFARLRSLSEPGPTLMAGLAVAALLLAWATWRFVEQPFRNRTSPVLGRQKSVFLVSGAAIALFAAVGLAGHVYHVQLREMWLKNNPDVAAVYLQIEAANSDANFGSKGDAQQQLDECRFNVPNLDEAVIQKLMSCHSRHGAGIMILGDSHAIDLFGVVASRFDAPFLIGLTQGNCRPHTKRDFCQYDKTLKLFHDNPNLFSRVIYSQAGFYLLLDESGKKGTRAMFSAHSMSEAIAGLTVDTDHVHATYAYLRQISAFVPVTWFGPRIEPHVPQNVLLRSGCTTAITLRPGQIDAFQRVDEDIRTLVQSDKVIRYISQIQTLDFQMSTDFLSCEALFFSDGDHYSTAGEIRFGKRLPDDFLTGGDPAL